MICSPNQWAGFYMTGTSVMKELNIQLSSQFHHIFFHLKSNKSRGTNQLPDFYMMKSR